MKLEDCRALGFSGIHILSDKVLDFMAQYVEEKGLTVDPEAGVRFPIMNFYMWVAMKEPVYGVIAEGFRFLDVGKLDALAPAEEFIRKQ
jgi:NDP-sugar pyrophosphorylase family protein